MREVSESVCHLLRSLLLYVSVRKIQCWAGCWISSGGGARSTPHLSAGAFRCIAEGAANLVSMATGEDSPETAVKPMPAWHRGGYRSCEARIGNLSHCAFPCASSERRNCSLQIICGEMPLGEGGYRFTLSGSHGRGSSIEKQARKKTLQMPFKRMRMVIIYQFATWLYLNELTRKRSVISNCFQSFNYQAIFNRCCKIHSIMRGIKW